MNILALTQNLLNDLDYFKQLTYTSYSMTDYEFLDILDERNGECYSFYRFKDKAVYWTFYRNQQEFSFKSMKTYTVKPGLAYKEKVIETLKNRPNNPFEIYNEYDIELASDTRCSIKNIKEIK
jgi:hypothetical protein